MWGNILKYQKLGDDFNYNVQMYKSHDLSTDLDHFTIHIFFNSNILKSEAWK